MTQQQAANAQQIAYWNEISGPKWVRLGDLIDAQIAPIGLHAIDRAAPSKGERVLDVGCGCGQTSIELARRVGASGQIVGIDISRPMLADAERRATEARGPGVRFVAGDAQTHHFDPGRFDLVFSRFGIMFFDDPAAAFANLHASLRPGGRLTFACWQAPDRNPWMTVPAAAAARHVEMPAPPDRNAPGPFAFADPDRVRALLVGAGFEDVEVESLERRVTIGRGLGMDELIEFLLQMGPTAAVLRESSEEIVDAVRESLRESVKPYLDGQDLVMDSATWIVTARRRDQASLNT